MDFKLSYNWLKEFVDVKWTPERIAEQLSLHSVSVERLHRLGDGLEHIIVGRIDGIRQHPNADRLRLVSVAVAMKGKPAEVVCGGTNLREGMLVAYATVGAKVRWHGEGEIVELKPAEIRGVRSEGMICSAREIGLEKYFTEGEREILDLTVILQEASRCPRSKKASPYFYRGRGKNMVMQSSEGGRENLCVVGQPIAQALGLDDIVFDIEVTTNRPDLMSVEELAREAAATANAKLIMQNAKLPKFNTRHAMGNISVRVSDKKGCPRYGAVVIDGVKVGPSPWWMQVRLLTAGLRPINNVVDATNYAMLELGQPLHAFDAAKLRASGISAQQSAIEIVVRRARAGEKIVALDGVTYALLEEDVIIADAERPIALAGIIGGQESGVTEKTTRIVLECANFDPIAIRKTSRRLNVRTDAAIRFEKGLQPDAIDHVIPRAVELIVRTSGGIVGKPVIVGQKPKAMRPIAFHPAHANERIGVAISSAQARRALVALGCAVQKKTSGIFFVTPPWWRRGDLEKEHDLIEEVARLYGYQRIPSALPIGTLPAAAAPARSPRTAFDVEQRAREILADTGGTEVMAYSLTSRTAIERCGFSVEQCVALENPLSEDFAYLRPSLIPTILPIIAQNEGHTPDGTVFELGNGYIPAGQHESMKARKLSSSPALHLPREEMRVLVAGYGGEGDVLRVKGKVERLFAALGIRGAEFRVAGECVMPPTSPTLPSHGEVGKTKNSPPHTGRGSDLSRPERRERGWGTNSCLWHPGRTMDVVIGGVLVGTIGEIHPTVVAAAGISQRIAVAELDWAAITPHVGARGERQAPSQFPPAKRDIAFILDRRVPYADIAAFVAGSDPLLAGAELFDVFEGRGIPEGKKSIAFHLTYSTSDRTLTTEEVEVAHAKLIAKLQECFGVEMRT